jgi:hypothetical protein
VAREEEKNTVRSDLPFFFFFLISDFVAGDNGLDT